MMADTIGIWLQAAITLLLLSVVFKDNPAYRVVEHAYIGLFAGYQVCTRWFTFVRPSIENQIVAQGRWYYVFPILIGLMIYARYVKPIAWIARYNISFILGIGCGYVLSKDIQPFFINQIRATFLPLWVSGNLQATFDNWVMVVGVFTTIGYFLFSVPKVGLQRHLSSVSR